MRVFKDSGIEWLGEIPEHWEVVKIKHIFNIGRGRVISQEELDENGNFPVYSSQTTNNGILGYIKTYDFDCEQITWTTDGVNAGTIFLRNGKYNCTNVCGILKPRNNENMSFLTYALQNVAPCYKRPDTNGAKIMNNEMANIQIVYPPLKEQEQIANFLDEKCEQIANFIEKKEKLISLLKEQKQVLINETITKGLDKNANFKDSGIEWLGEIPQHWEIVKLKYLGNFQNGISINSEAFGVGYPFVSYGDVYNNISIPFDVKGLVNSTEIDRKIYSVKQGDIFFTRTSETIDEIGISSVCLKTIENAVFAGFLIRFRADKKILDNNFAKFYFRRNLNQYFLQRKWFGN
ncbi:restriction endonuclease subunit S [Campylobacter jejuni]|nr:restriction endonuclease subunit S [Campylobacter jejuni]